MPAATQTVSALVSLEEYLHTSYHPDCDFVDGVLDERNVGAYDHSNLQAAITSRFFVRGREWEIRMLPEQRTRVGETRVRIPRTFALSNGARRFKR